MFQQTPNQAPAMNLPANCVVTPEVRLSHFKCYAPAQDLNNNMKYMTTLLIPKSVDLSQINVAVQAAVMKGIKEKWGGYQPVNLQLPVNDGDIYASQKPEKRGAYVGHWYINASQNPEIGQPIILNENRVRSTNQQEVQSGDYAVVVLEFIPFNNKSQGVTAIPKVIRKTRTGEHFGGGVSEGTALAAIGGEVPAEVGYALAGGQPPQQPMQPMGLNSLF